MVKSNRRLWLAAVCLVCGGALTTQATAALIDGDFSPGGGAVQSGAAVFGASGDIWNNLSNSGTAVVLNDVTGTPTPVTLTWTSSSGTLDTADSAMDAATTALMEDYAAMNGDTLALTGLQPSTAYQICLYGAGKQTPLSGNAIGGQGSKFTIPQGANPSVVGATTEVNPTTPTIGDRMISDGPGVAYVVLTANSDALGNLSVNVAYNSNAFSTAPVNGFQIQPVPEPASIGFLGMAAITLLRKRRRA